MLDPYSRSRWHLVMTHGSDQTGLAHLMDRNLRPRCGAHVKNFGNSGTLEDLGCQPCRRCLKVRLNKDSWGDRLSLWPSLLPRKTALHDWLDNQRDAERYHARGIQHLLLRGALREN